MRLPVLVDCVPYHARLSVASCADRWRKGQTVTDGKGMGLGQKVVRNGNRRGVLFECITCPVGKRRAKGA